MTEYSHNPGVAVLEKERTQQDALMQGVEAKAQDPEVIARRDALIGQVVGEYGAQGIEPKVAGIASDGSILATFADHHFAEAYEDEIDTNLVVAYSEVGQEPRILHTKASKVMTSDDNDSMYPTSFVIRGELAEQLYPGSERIIGTLSVEPNVHLDKAFKLYRHEGGLVIETPEGRKQFATPESVAATRKFVAEAPARQAAEETAQTARATERELGIQALQAEVYGTSRGIIRRIFPGLGREVERQKRLGAEGLYNQGYRAKKDRRRS